jgi:diaminohydroxyphosphoribosylaminopyrimidine deaminase/5-amino-6-(5-phosphoribosylamino)uracil reductase
LDDKLRLGANLARTTGEAPVVLVGRSEGKKAFAEGVEVVNTNPKDLLPVLETLGRREIQSVLVEGGASVAGSFIEAKLVNKVSFFIAPKIVGGTDAPSAIGGKGIERMAAALELERIEVTQRGRDLEVTGYPAGQLM